MQPILLNRTAVGLSRPSQGESGAFVRPPRRCKKLSKLAASARRGCPGQARAGRVRLLGDLTYATDPAQSDSRGLVPAIPRRMRSIRPHTRRCKKTSKLAASARRGCPGQAWALRAGVVCDLRFTTDLAEPDSRGTRLCMTCQGCKR